MSSEDGLRDLVRDIENGDIMWDMDAADGVPVAQVVAKALEVCATEIATLRARVEELGQKFEVLGMQGRCIEGYALTGKESWKTMSKLVVEMWNARCTYERRAEKAEGALSKVSLALNDVKRTSHMECEDTWYSCPKSAEGCADDAAGNDCLCGADEWNAGLDAAIAATDPEPRPPAPHSKNCGEEN